MEYIHYFGTDSLVPDSEKRGKDGSIVVVNGEAQFIGDATDVVHGESGVMPIKVDDSGWGYYDGPSKMKREDIENIVRALGSNIAPSNSGGPVYISEYRKKYSRRETHLPTIDGTHLRGFVESQGSDVAFLGDTDGVFDVLQTSVSGDLKIDTSDCKRPHPCYIADPTLGDQFSFSWTTGKSDIATGIGLVYSLIDYFDTTKLTLPKSSSTFFMNYLRYKVVFD